MMTRRYLRSGHFAFRRRGNEIVEWRRGCGHAEYAVGTYTREARLHMWQEHIHVGSAALEPTDVDAGCVR